MIYVDELRPGKTPWGGWGSCHMISDVSPEDLKSFALSIGLPTHWFQPGSFPHFDLSSNWRRRAVAAGAVQLNRTDYVRVMQRAREAWRWGEIPPR